MQRKSRSTPAQLQIFENGARSAHAPEILEVDPELELKFRSGPTTVSQGVGVSLRKGEHWPLGQKWCAQK